MNNNDKEVKIQPVSPQEIADIVNAQSLNEAEKVITGGIFYNKPANDYVRNNIENIETIHDSMPDNVKTNPLYRLGKGVVDRINGFAYGLTGLPNVTQEFYNNIPRFGQQLQEYKNNPSSMVNDTVDYFTNPYNDPLVPLDIAAIASVPASLGKLGGVAKVANTKPILNPKTNIPEITNGKTFAEIVDKKPSDYLNSSVKEYFIENRKGNTLGFGPYLLNKYTGIPLEEARSMAANSIKRNDYNTYWNGGQASFVPSTQKIGISPFKLLDDKPTSVAEHDMIHQALYNIDNLSQFSDLGKYNNFVKQVQQITNNNKPIYRNEAVPMAVQKLQDSNYIPNQKVLDKNNLTTKQIDDLAKIMEEDYNNFLYQRFKR